MSCCGSGPADVHQQQCFRNVPFHSPGASLGQDAGRFLFSSFLCDFFFILFVMFVWMCVSVSVCVCFGIWRPELIPLCLCVCVSLTYMEAVGLAMEVDVKRNCLLLCVSVQCVYADICVCRSCGLRLQPMCVYMHAYFCVC